MRARLLSLFHPLLAHRAEGGGNQCAFGDIIITGQGHLVWNLDTSIPAESVRAQGDNVTHGYNSRRRHRLREQRSGRFSAPFEGAFAVNHLNPGILQRHSNLLEGLGIAFEPLIPYQRESRVIDLFGRLETKNPDSSMLQMQYMPHDPVGTDPIVRVDTGNIIGGAAVDGDKRNVPLLEQRNCLHIGLQPQSHETVHSGASNRPEYTPLQGRNDGQG